MKKGKVLVNVKKEYITPDLCFESFTLSQSIAAGCSSGGITAAQEWMGTYFDSTSTDTRINNCSDQWVDSTYQVYCYWNGADSYKLFLS